MGNVCNKVESKYRKLGYAEVYAGKEDDYEDNANFKEIQIGQDFSVLVAKIGRHYHSIGARCPHAGGPLGEGYYDDGRIYCPWHGSCFDFETGDIEEFPSLDCVPKYPVSTRRGKVYVYVNTNNIQMQIVKPMSKLTDNSMRMAIIGGGGAGYMCAQTLRQEGYTGIITMYTKEPYLPYDRTKLSKELGCKWIDIKLRGKEFYLENDIEVRLNTTVDHIDIMGHKIYTHGSPTTYSSYDSIFIAVGNRPSQNLDPSRGYQLKNITTLHDLQDAKFIAANVKGKKVLIVGSSFLAMELVTMLKDTATTGCESIDILSRQKSPYRAILGGEVGTVLLKYLKSRAENHNITFHDSNDVNYFEGNPNGEVCACVTINKEIIFCDFVILANGALPNTELFDDTKLTLDKMTGAIVVNKFLETNIKHTFAGGDCCRFPLNCAAQNSAVIEHWQVALTHGRVAALNMLNEEQKISISDIVPFYWTVCGDIVIKYCGHGQYYNEILIFQPPKPEPVEQLEPDPQFCAIYRRGTKIVAACAASCDSLIVEISVALQSQSEWNSEFPECLTKRFPNEPIKMATNFGIRPELEHDLLKSDLEIAFLQALAYDRVEAPPEPFIPLKSTLLDVIDDVDVGPKGAFAQSEEDRIELLRKQREDFETKEITLGLYTKLPITEFGEDEGIPILPQTYIPTKDYMAFMDKKYGPAAKSKPIESEPEKPSRSKHRRRIDSVPRFQRSDTSMRKSKPSKSSVKITTIVEPPKHGTNLLELPKQHVKANPKLSPASAAASGGIARRASSYGAIEGIRREASPLTQKKIESMTQETEATTPRKSSFRSELAGISGKKYTNPRSVRSAPSLSNIQAEAETVPRFTHQIGTITQFPLREPLVDPFLDSGTPKKILIPQSLTPSVEIELNVGVLDSLKPRRSKSTKFSLERKPKGTLPRIENDEYLHDKPNYKRLVNKDTTQIAKLIMKQYPEVTRARAHLSGNQAPLLETYPRSSTMTPLLMTTPSQQLQEEIEKQQHEQHRHGLSIKNPRITITKRVNYDFEK